MTEATSPAKHFTNAAAFPRRRTRALLLSTILILSVGCDQGTKWWAETSLAPQRAVSMAGDTFRLQYAENPGAFLGLGGSLSPEARFWLLTAVNGVFLAIIGGILVFRWHMEPVQFIALALLFSGGLGNLIDRVTQNGYVTDFLNVGIGPYHVGPFSLGPINFAPFQFGLRTGIFNVADMAIMAGAGLLFWLSFQSEPNEPTVRES